MSEQEIEREQVIQNFINSYHTYKTSSDVSEITLNIVIPNFSILACELEQIIESINTENSLQSESMDFIELVFNPNLYQVIWDSMDKTQDKFTHYTIALVEFIKLEQYNKIYSRLMEILSDGKISNTILVEGILQASKERIDNCTEKIKQIYWDLEKSYPTFLSSKYAIQMLLESNGFKL